MKKKLLILLTLILAVSCSKEVLKPSGKVLFETTVESGAGSVDVLVKTSGVWSASSLSEWIIVDQDLHKDNYVITLLYSSNRSIEGQVRPERSGRVLVRSYDGGQCDTLVINQRGMEL